MPRLLGVDARREAQHVHLTDEMRHRHSAVSVDMTQRHEGITT